MSEPIPVLLTLKSRQDCGGESEETELFTEGTLRQTPEGWERRLDWGNLEAVCTRCHNSRHANRWKGKKNSSVLDVREVAHQCRTPGGG